MKYSVLTIDSGIVKLENEIGEISYFDTSEMPDEIKTNDILEKNDGGFVILPDETEKRRDENINLINSLWED